MKTFLFSVCVLTLLVGVILLNAGYVRSVTSKMCDELQDLPRCNQASDLAQAIRSHWDDKKSLLELSVAATDMNDVENQLTALCVAAKSENEEAFEQARALCLLAMARIRDLDRFRFLHIL